MTVGIYLIRNTVNGKVYIGQTRCLETRWRIHRNQLLGNKHFNKHLQASWNKYNGAFEFEIVLYCSRQELNEMEIALIELSESFNAKIGFNKTKGGEHFELTEEGKRNIGNSKRGIPLSEEHKAKIGRFHKGKVVSEDTRKKLSASGLGRVGANLGKCLSEETKRKMAEAKLGKKRPPFTEEHKQKISMKMLGRKYPKS
jgi:group I intron endonuclease